MRRRFGLDIPETIEDACDPATMAVVVYDMQAGVLRQLPDGTIRFAGDARGVPGHSLIGIIQAPGEQPGR